MTLPGPVPDSLISSRDRSRTHRSRFLSFRDRSRPAGTDPGETGTDDFPPTTLRTCSRTYRGSCSAFVDARTSTCPRQPLALTQSMTPTSRSAVVFRRKSVVFALTELASRRAHVGYQRIGQGTLWGAYKNINRVDAPVIISF